jgi:hypothetical protein
MARTLENTLEVRAKAELKIRDYLKNKSKPGTAESEDDWALNEFDELFPEGSIQSRSRDFCRAQIMRYYPLGDIVETANVSSLYEKELEFLKAKIFSNRATPKYIKEIFLSDFGRHIECGYGFSPAISDKEFRKTVLKTLQRIQEETSTAEEYRLPKYKLPVNVSEHIFGSSFYSEALKNFALALSKTANTDAFLRIWDNADTNDFITRHNNYRLIGLYIVMARHFDFSGKLKQREAADRVLPFMHTSSVQVIEKFMDWRKGNIEQDLRQLFDYRPKGTARSQKIQKN